MGIGFAFMCWAVAGCIALAFYLLLSPNATAKKALKIAGAVVGVVIVLNIAVRIPDLFPSYVFGSSFGFYPTPDVRELKGGRSRLGDMSDAYLRFRANKQTIERIVTGKRFYEIDENAFRTYMPSGSPTYWKPFEGKPTRFYASPSASRNFGSEWEVLCYEETDGLAHYYWVDVD